MWPRKKANEPAPGEDDSPGDDSIADELRELPPVEPDWREQFLRAAAEIENLKKRMKREVTVVRQHERENILRSFLGVLDNFDRALGMQGAEANQWTDGFNAIRDHFLDVLRSHGATPFDSLGEEFDPFRHEAVAAIHAEGREPGTIVEVIQSGYVIEGGDVLRPAKVIVAK